MASNTSLPDEVFHVVAFVFPHIVRIAEQCECSPIEIFTLWYVRHFGKLNTDGRRILLRHELTEMFQKQFQYTAQAVSNLTTRLHQRGLLLSGRVNRDEQRTLFIHEGRMGIVVLSQEGEEKIDEFKTKMRELFSALLPRMPRLLRAPLKQFLPWAGKIGAWVLKPLAKEDQWA